MATLPSKEPKHYIKAGILYLVGQIDERVDYSALSSLPRPMVVNFSGVTNVNSVGLKRFVEFVTRNQAGGFEFHELTEPVIDFINMIPAALGKPPHPEFVKSMIVPYVCDHCAKETLAVLTIDARPGDVPLMPAISCERCHLPMESRLSSEDLFTYLVASD